jgi:hypothetical protein
MVEETPALKVDAPACKVADKSVGETQALVLGNLLVMATPADIPARKGAPSARNGRATTVFSLMFPLLTIECSMGSLAGIRFNEEPFFL